MIKKLLDNFDYEEIEFSVSKKDWSSKIEVKNKICINGFCYESKFTYPVHISNKKFTNSMDLLILSDKIKSHYVHMKTFNKVKTKTKQKQKVLL